MATSKTAEYVAFYRALETLELRRDPLFRDPYASVFLGPTLALALAGARVAPAHRLLERYIERRAPGARITHAARTRFIDDLVGERITEGAKQLVVLGAGFDCRAHRIEALRGIRVYEVDRGEMQRKKRARLRRAAAQVRSDIRYVPADLLDDDVAERLDEAGFERAWPTLFVCEGVANYLPLEDVRRVLSWIGRSVTGSSLVFSYVHRGLLERSLDSPGSERTRRAVQALSEPWLSGFHPSELQTELSNVGLTLRQDLGADEYRRRYLREGTEAARFSFYRLAVAEVC